MNQQFDHKLHHSLGLSQAYKEDGGTIMIQQKNKPKINRPENSEELRQRLNFPLCNGSLAFWNSGKPE